MRLRHVLAASAAAALVLTACGTSSDDANDVAAPDADTEGTLTVWLMEGSQPDST